MPIIGIDIGSTATKAVVMEEKELLEILLCPTGFSSVDAATKIAAELEAKGYSLRDCRCVATGYGRISVPYAEKVVTEITCHARGSEYLFGQDGVIIDIGGQDTKIIMVGNGKVLDFVMNDKCSAGTGKFLEIMANRLGVSQEELSSLASEGKPTSITSLCTVFAESEVISLIGSGTPREDIAYGIIESVVTKIVTLASRNAGEQYFLTGGLCDNEYVVTRLQAKLGKPVLTKPLTRYAGAIGAALSAEKATKRL